MDKDNKFIKLQLLLYPAAFNRSEAEIGWSLDQYDLRTDVDIKMDFINDIRNMVPFTGALYVERPEQVLDPLFSVGDVEDYSRQGPVDMMVTLHACDTATDYALYKAVEKKASVILSVPCCQHELNRQYRSEELSFAPLGDYGILRDRFCALATDGIRAKLLEAAGYDTQILEFIDMEHTPKNLLIRAVRRRSGGREECRAQA